MVTHRMITGNVLQNGEKLGTFTVISDDKVELTLNGGRWDIRDVFLDALKDTAGWGKSIVLVPTEDDDRALPE